MEVALHFHYVSYMCFDVMELCTSCEPFLCVHSLIATVFQGLFSLQP
jgi:hypothetical protein